MNNRILAIVIIALVILLGGWFFLSSNPEEAIPVDTSAPSPSPAGVAGGTDLTPATGGSVISIPGPIAPIVTYIDAGYTPNTLRVARGTTVTFQNGHTVGMWTATDAHPTHGNYPTTGGCIGSTFDSCRAIPSGETWSFTFNIPGTWSYHNHLRSQDRGTIVVE